MACGLLGMKTNHKGKSGYYSDSKLDKQWTYWAEDGRKTNETTYEKGEKKWSDNKLECR